MSFCNVEILDTIDSWNSYKSEMGEPQRINTTSILNDNRTSPRSPLGAHDTYTNTSRFPSLVVPPNTPILEQSIFCSVLPYPTTAEPDPTSEVDSSADIDSMSILCDSSLSTWSSELSEFELCTSGVGLGLSGLVEKDSERPFNGLGLVDIHGWLRRSNSQSRSADGLSSAFLGELTASFMEDPLHEHCLVTTSECLSHDANDLVLKSQISPVLNDVFLSDLDG